MASQSWCADGSQKEIGPRQTKIEEIAEGTAYATAGFLLAEHPGQEIQRDSTSTSWCSRERFHNT